ncbi:MAG: Spy/CpxP family protein refolding chaperone [Acidobacteriota bacterium]
MKKLRLSVVVAVAALMGTAALPQEDQLPGPVRVLQHFLQLTDEQVSQFLDLRGALEEQVTPLRESIRAAEEALSQELESDSPSVESVGSLVIQIRGLRRQVGEARHDMVEGFQQILTEDQARRLAAARRAAHLRRLLPALQSLGLVP